MEVRRLAAALLLPLLLSGVARAQTQTESTSEQPADYRPDFTGRPVAGVILVTPPGHAPGDFSRFLEIRRGDVYGTAKVRRTIEVLSKLGDFQSIEARAADTAAGVYVTFTLVPVPRIRKVVVHGADDDTKVIDALGVVVGDPWTGAATIEPMRQSVERSYVRDGWWDAKAKIAALPMSDGDVLLRVDLDQGVRRTVGAVEFAGDLAFAPEQLLPETNLKPGDPLRQSAIDTARRRLVRFHKRADFLEVRIADQQPTDFEPMGGGGGGRTKITFHIDSGEKIDVVLQRKSFARADRRADPLWWWTFRNAEILKVIDVEGESQFTEGFGDEAADRLAAWFRARGYLEAKVAATMDVEAAKRVKTFTFDVDPGRRFKLVSVDFAGTDVNDPIVKPATLREQFFAASEPMRKGYFVPDDAEPAIDAAINYLRSEGYTDVHVSAKDPEIDHLRHTVRLAFNVEPGSRSIVGKVDFENAHEAPEAKLRDVVAADPMDIKPGAPLNAVYLDKADGALQDFYASIGYPYASITHTAQSGTAGLVDIHFDIDEQVQVVMGRVIVHGNRYTRRDVIDRALPFRTGEIWTPQALADGADSLKKLGTFSHISIGSPGAEEDAEPVQDVVVDVTEAPRIWAEPSVGASSIKGPRLGLNAQDRNLFGRAKSLSLRAQANWLWGGFLGPTRGIYTRPAPHLDTAQIEGRLLLTYSQPTTFGRPITSSITGSAYERTRTRGFGYIGNRLIGTGERAFTVNGPLAGANVKVVAGYQVFLRDILYHQTNSDSSRQSFAALEPADLSLHKQQQMFYWPFRWRIAGLTAGVTADHRDNVFNPTRGWSAVLNGELNDKSLWSQISFAKLTGTLSVYQPMPLAWDLVVVGRGGWGVPFDGSTGLPVDQRFHLGDTGSVRGFKEDSIGPHFSNVHADISTGGDVMGVYNVEMRHPLVPGFDVVLFHDLGWTNVLHTQDVSRRAPYDVDSGDEHQLLGRLLNPSSPKTSVGAGLRVRSPIGPVKIDFGVDTGRVKTLNAAAGWSNVKFHFTIGDF